MNQKIVIRVNNLSKSYKLYNANVDRLKEALNPFKKVYHKEHFALSNINFEIKQGEIIGIIGTNGSGKSTLLKLLCNIATPTSGTIEIKGKVSVLLELGAGFNLEYTGLQNIYLNGTMMGYSENEMKARVSQIIEFADIGDFINQPTKNYSSGMFARLAFAVAINVEPDILIVDEALSVGDVFFQNKCFRKFEELKDKGITILFVSHDMESIKQMCSKVLWIEHGKQKMFGDKLEVCNAYTKQFLIKNNEDVDSAKCSLKDKYQITDFNLSRYPAINYMSESLLHPSVRIKACFIENQDGEVCYECIGGDIYKMSIIFETDITIDDCIVGFVLQNKKGVSILNTNTLICGENKVFRAKENCIYRIDFTFKFPTISNDEYVIDCAVASGNSVINSTMYTWLFGVLRVIVHNPNECLALFSIDAKVDVFQKDNNDSYKVY